MTLSKSEILSRYGKRGSMIRWNKQHLCMRENLEKRNKPEDLLLKAKLCGFLAGDGRVTIRRGNKKKTSIHYEVNFYPDHESLVESYLEAFEYLYTKKPSVIEEDKHYRIKTSCKIACLDLLNISKFGTYGWEIPFEFLQSHELKREWLRAFFDCEGYVGERQIQVQSVNKKGIYQIKKLLEKFQINSNIYSYERKNKNWNTNYILSIMKKESRRRFLEKIGFNHNIKLLKLSKQNLLTT